MDFGPADVEWLIQSLHQPFGYTDRIRWLCQLIQNYREFVATQTRDAVRARKASERIGGAEAMLESLGKRNEELIARNMTQAVIDHLETIDVEEEDGKIHTLVPLRPLEQVSQTIQEERAGPDVDRLFVPGPEVMIESRQQQLLDLGLTVRIRRWLAGARGVGTKRIRHMKVWKETGDYNIDTTRKCP